MNGRVLAIGSGLLVAATSAAIVGAASAAADGESTRTPRPAVRAAVDLPSVDPALKARTEAVNIARWVRAVNERRFYDVVTVRLELERQAAAAAAARRRSRGSVGSSGGDVLACIKQRESRGQYGAVNGSSGAAGAYQFMPSTWNKTATNAGRTDLVGVNPANASVADQDAMARHLLAWQGLGPWGGGCG
jgi:hypothetical protein